MKYLLDTNVLSETVKPQPEGTVIRWIDSMAPEHLCISALTIGEVRRGVEKLPEGKRKERFIHWLEEEIPVWFRGRIVPVDENVADTWGIISSHAKRTIPVIDCLLAATAILHRMTLVTRNQKDFSIPGLEVFNPWK